MFTSNSFKTSPSKEIQRLLDLLEKDKQQLVIDALPMLKQSNFEYSCRDYADLAYIYFKLNDYGDGEFYADKALDKNPTEPGIIAHLLMYKATSLSHQQKHNLAWETIVSANEILPNDLAIKYNYDVIKTRKENAENLLADTTFSFI